MRIYFYPGTIGDVSLSTGPGSGEIIASWTSPGADGNQRTGASYVVKYSTYPDAIATQDYFANTAATFSQALSPLAPGGSETLTLTGLQPGTSYYVAIEARDGETPKNQGYLSNSTYTWAQIYVLGVDVANQSSPADFYGFGSVAMSSAVVSTATIRVTNTGTAPATWSLRAATTTAGSPWQLTRGALGTDVLRLSAGFDEVQPSTGAFSATSGDEDRMITTDTLASGATFSIDGSATGVNVPISQHRDVWFLLETPLATSTTAQQNIQVTVTANAP
ncbi:MAG: fibronectin type III domain-containing protein [Elusimicrobiota bacterium]